MIYLLGYIAMHVCGTLFLDRVIGAVTGVAYLVLGGVLVHVQGLRVRANWMFQETLAIEGSFVNLLELRCKLTKTDGRPEYAF